MTSVTILETSYFIPSNYTIIYHQLSYPHHLLSTFQHHLSTFQHYLVCISAYKTWPQMLSHEVVQAFQHTILDRHSLVYFVLRKIIKITFSATEEFIFQSDISLQQMTINSSEYDYQTSTLYASLDCNVYLPNGAHLPQTNSFNGIVSEIVPSVYYHKYVQMYVHINELIVHCR